MKNYTKKKHKENERKERGKGEEKGNSATPARGELQSTITKLCPTCLTSEYGYWNCTNAQKLYMQAYLYRAENKLLASCYKRYNQTTTAQLHVGNPQNSESFLLAIHLFVKRYYRFTTEYILYSVITIGGNKQSALRITTCTNYITTCCQWQHI